MAYALFSTERLYNVGDIVIYEGGTYVFLYPHTPGEWNVSQVLAINPSFAYQTVIQDFNTIPNYNLSSPLPVARYRINYYINNDEVTVPPPTDNQTYLMGDTAVCAGLSTSTYYYSVDGVWAYRWVGWSLNSTSNIARYLAGQEITMTSADINLYAVWDKTCVLAVTPEGRVTINIPHHGGPQTLIIPEYIGPVRTHIIGKAAFSGSTIRDIVIPPSITDIEEHAFKQWYGGTIRFIDADVTTKYPSLKLHGAVFADTMSLIEIILPYRWRSWEPGESGDKLFPIQFKTNTFNIYIRNTKEFMSSLLNQADVETYIAGPNQLSSPYYKRNIYWGYND